MSIWNGLVAPATATTYTPAAGACFAGEEDVFPQSKLLGVSVRSHCVIAKRASLPGFDRGATRKKNDGVQRQHGE